MKNQSAIERKINTLMTIQNAMKNNLLEVYRGWEPVGEGLGEEVDDGYFDHLIQFLMTQKNQWDMVESITNKIKNMIKS